jgi:acyl dehydratase
VALEWESIQEGLQLPEQRRTLGVPDLVKYAAGSGDFNPLHYDFNFPQSKALGSIIVHGRFKYALLGQLVSDWLQHRGRIKKISCQYRGMDLPGQEIVCRGRVVRKWEEGGERLVEVSVWTEDEAGKKTTPGQAVVVFH